MQPVLNKSRNFFSAQKLSRVLTGTDIRIPECVNPSKKQKSQTLDSPLSMLSARFQPTKLILSDKRHNLEASNLDMICYSGSSLQGFASIHYSMHLFFVEFNPLGTFFHVQQLSWGSFSCLLPLQQESLAIKYLHIVSERVGYSVQIDKKSSLSCA